MEKNLIILTSFFLFSLNLACRDNNQKQHTEIFSDTSSDLDFPLKPGMPNLGNTCFANSATTFLFENPDFHKHLDGDLRIGQLLTLPRENYKQFSTRKEFQKHALNLFEKRVTNNSYDLSVKPSAEDIRNELGRYFDSLETASKEIDGTEKIGGYDGAKLREQQGDSFDFASKVLEYLEYAPPGFAQIIQFVDGSLKVLPQYNPITSLNLDKISSDPNKKFTFRDVFDQNTQSIAMTGNNRIAKDDGTKMDSQMFYGFVSYSPTLMFRLERFKWDLGSDGNVTQVKIESELGLDYEIEVKQINPDDGKSIIESSYHLKAVSVHSGSSPKSGHYYTYVYEKDAKQWVLYDDISVQLVEEEVVAKDIAKNGYLFLYSH
ncbi:MAG: ubiquitin carboxyl-terminal hydrolase family protein [Oligoflexales bacterium]